jgi:hypothetical protein
MNKELEIIELEQQIQQLKNELCMLCDSDYYNQCDLIEQLEIQLKILRGKDNGNN